MRVHKQHAAYSKTLPSNPHFTLLRRAWISILSQQICSSGHTVWLAFAVQINMGNERPEIRNTEFIFQTITVVSLNKYLLWNVKGSELTLVFHCHYVLIVWSAQRFCLFRIWLQFVVTTNEDEFGVVWFSGLFSNFNELRCMTLMWLCDPANTSRQRTENKMVWAFFLPLWAYRSSCCMTWTSKRTNSFLPFWKILREYVVFPYILSTQVTETTDNLANWRIFHWLAVYVSLPRGLLHLAPAYL